MKIGSVCALAMLLSGCATIGNRVGSIAEVRAVGCFEAASGRLPVDQGIKVCTQALADARLPGELRAATLTNRGIVNMQAKHMAAALVDYDAAIAMAPGNADAWINKGIALLRIGGRDEDAVATLTEALARDPKTPALAYYHRAVANEALGRMRAAYDDYAEAAVLAPEWAEPANQLQRFKFVRRKTLAG